jgi:uncharacterized RDD family membrane protein YckC
MVLVGLLIVVISLVYQFGRQLLGGYADAVLALLVFAVMSLYWILFEFFGSGVTPGKRVMGLRVIGDRGLPLTLGQVVLRNLVRFVDLLPGPGGVAALTMALHPQHKRLGDLVAGTLVIRDSRGRPPERVRGLASAAAGGLSISARCLAGLSREERALIIDLSFRRDRLADGVRLELFGEVAERLRSLSGLDAPHELSDENLVLALSAALLDRGVT